MDELADARSGDCLRFARVDRPDPLPGGCVRDPLRHNRVLEAGNGIRTRDPQLGKLMLYQLSYPRIHTRFYPAQDLLALGIYNVTNHREAR
jgi:hypothetical protein